MEIDVKQLSKAKFMKTYKNTEFKFYSSCKYEFTYYVNLPNNYIAKVTFGGDKDDIYRFFAYHTMKLKDFEYLVKYIEIEKDGEQTVYL